MPDLVPSGEFEQFWRQYPRKVAKRHAWQMWVRLSPEQRDKAIEVIGEHANVWRLEEREPHRIPHAGTWLNGWRFDDELEVPKPKAQVPIAGWWADERLTLEMGARYGMAPRPGEDWGQFRSRLRERMAA